MLKTAIIKWNVSLEYFSSLICMGVDGRLGAFSYFME
jgi:hypothetical protein